MRSVFNLERGRSADLRRAQRIREWQQQQRYCKRPVTFQWRQILRLAQRPRPLQRRCAAGSAPAPPSTSRRFASHRLHPPNNLSQLLVNATVSLDQGDVKAALHIFTQARQQSQQEVDGKFVV